MNKNLVSKFFIILSLIIITQITLIYSVEANSFNIQPKSFVVQTNPTPKEVAMQMIEVSKTEKLKTFKAFFSKTVLEKLKKQEAKAKNKGVDAPGVDDFLVLLMETIKKQTYPFDDSKEVIKGDNATFTLKSIVPSTDKTSKDKYRVTLIFTFIKEDDQWKASDCESSFKLLPATKEKKHE